MAHFTVMVIGDNPEEQLDKFNINLEVAPRILYTRQELIDKEKAEIDSYRAIYAEYISDPEEYKRKYSYLFYSSPSKQIQFLEEELPKRFQWTDEEILEYALKWFNKEDIDENSNILTRLNPNSKLDYYTLKSRFTEEVLKIKENALKDYAPQKKSKINVAYKRDIANFDKIIVSAVVKDGLWYEKPYTGFWWKKLISNEVENDNYKEVGEKICDSISEDTLISIFACHI